MAVRLLPQYRGIRVRPYMRYMNQILFSLFWLPLLVGLGFYVYVNIAVYLILDWFQIGLTIGLFIGSIVLAIYLTWFLQEATPFFKKCERLGRLAFFLYEHKYVYEQKKSNGSGQSIKFPKIYLQQGKYDLSIHFKMAGNKFQDKFKKIGGELEDTFFMDFMETLDEPKFKIYKLAYSAYLNRITIPEVAFESGKGIRLMKNFYWDFNSDPHLLVAGGTGGGKTVFLSGLVLGLSKIGTVDICDPKRADFVAMSDLSAFQGRVVFEISDIVQRFQDARVIMMARYDFMRSEMKRLGHKDLKKYYEYGLEPYFFVCDEYQALMAMLDFRQRGLVEDAIAQFLLLGRQAGCFGVLAMQKPSREDLGSKLQANINFRISVGRLDDGGYQTLFGDENRNKEFKYLKYLSGRRVYGRGYATVFGEVAREFYSPLLPKKFSFYDEFVKVERHNNQFDPRENNQIVADIVNKPELVDFVERVTKNREFVEEVADEEKILEEISMTIEERLSVSDVVEETEKTFSQITKLVSLLEQEDYHQFTREDGNILFSNDEVQLLTRLFEKKEVFEGTWKQLLSQYFTGE
ncbi:FtsK/SpoIIIE domain-containing protein [Streptococcus constellatus]|uniref:FtsK/SpoIIIE domain-containing protein n=1 Tax=Streptococcus constellatus TaxID=76860 RepID=UPI001E3C5266|nr:FtsK/SpoIIIE domain-containing protein [Streptococcus constellatus]